MMMFAYNAAIVHNYNAATVRCYHCDSLLAMYTCSQTPLPLLFPSFADGVPTGVGTPSVSTPVGFLSLSLSFSPYTHTNRYTSSLTHSLKMILYEVRLFCIHYYNIMYIMKCLNVCVCTYISQYYVIALSLNLLV